MMLTHYQRLVEVEGFPWNWETVMQGAAERLTPILMTSLVTACGLFPLALAHNSAGREVEGAMAIVIVGGLMTSVVFNLFCLPLLAFRYGRFVRSQ